MGLFDIGKQILGGALSGGGGIIHDELPLHRKVSQRTGIEFLDNIAASTKNLEDATDPMKRVGHALTDLTVEEAKRKFRKGDHIATMRSVYSHHGIYDGNGYVYEYQDGVVTWNSLSTFAAGDKLYQVSESSKYSPNKIIERAESRLGEQKYNVVYNNCENFATWCRCGD